MAAGIRLTTSLPPMGASFHGVKMLKTRRRVALRLSILQAATHDTCGTRHGFLGSVALLVAAIHYVSS